MKYFEVIFHIKSVQKQIAADILSALLADEGFEAFESSDNGLLSWVQQSVYTQEGVDNVIATFPLPDTVITYSVSEAPDQNWNSQWEQEGFRPIVIRECDTPDSPVMIAIHDTSHTDVPQARYDISINPCQAFGTGSHETTRMILRHLLSMPMQGRIVIDAGTGTGILAILCNMLGAAQVLAYDIDDWSVRNAQSNLLLNGIHEGVQVFLGDSSVLYTCLETGDCSVAPTLVIANINRNILLADMSRFASVLSVGGELLLSGFYTQDVPALLACAAENGLTLEYSTQDAGWALVLLKKEKSY